MESKMGEKPLPHEPDVNQEMRIKAILALRRPRENMTVMARNIGLPYGTVAGTVYGYKRNPEVQNKIAAYLGRGLEEIFGGNGHGL
jgi:hypothetical protein